MSELKIPYLNVVHLAGRLVHDPHKLTAEGGRVGVSFVLACNRYQKGKPTISTFVEMVAWGDLAEVLLTYCTAGSALLIEGGLAQYEKKGQPKKLQVSVQTAQLLDKKPAEPPKA